MSRNLAASIRARLMQRADAMKQDFNLTLTHYGLERLLAPLGSPPEAVGDLVSQPRGQGLESGVASMNAASMCGIKALASTFSPCS